MIKNRKKEQVKLNGNSSFVTFSEDGSFNIASIQDYGAGNIDGTFKFDEESKKITVVVSKKHLSNKKVKVGGKMVYKVLSLEKKILVLKRKGQVTYYYLSKNRLKKEPTKDIVQVGNKELQKGIWEEYRTNKKFSQSFLDDMIKDRRKEQTKLNENSSFYTFVDNGIFNVVSIQDSLQETLTVLSSTMMNPKQSPLL
ncbi:MAG: hypothetical protein HRT57_11935 [Crocinitomicaceae bacterium]|nr:hypothetical protein [Crocinitomicaceae bacterium]